MAAKSSASANPTQLRGLQKLLGYQFTDESLLRQALRHSSAGGQHNERLEFLGDSIVGYVAAKMLYDQFPRLSEGELTRLRSTVVRGVSLAALGAELGLAELVEMGPSELKGGGFRRDSTLADTFEALMAAILLDSDYPTAEQVVARLFAPVIDHLPSPESLKDPKTRLQEYWQSRQCPPPVYTLISSAGPDHKRSFTVSCTQSDRVYEATGSSRRKAEQAAAAMMLEALDV